MSVQAIARERTAEWRCAQAEALLARASGGSSSLPAASLSSAPPLDLTRQEAAGDSPGSWWTPHEGGWITSDSNADSSANTPAAEPSAAAGANGNGASPSSSGGTARDATEWGAGYGYGWYSNWHKVFQADNADGANGGREDAAPAGGGGRGGGAAGAAAGSECGKANTNANVDVLLGVSAEAADDWHQTVRRRACGAAKATARAYQP